MNLVRVQQIRSADRLAVAEYFLALSAAVLFQLGSIVHLFDTALSGTNILSVILLPLLLHSVAFGRFSGAGWFGLAGFALLNVAVLMSAWLHPHPDNFRLVRAAVVATSGVFWGSLLGNRFPDLARRVVEYGFLVTLSFACLQFTFVKFGIGLDPSVRFASVTYSAEASLAAGYPSIFANPNDFSVFSCLVFLFVLFRNNAFDRVIGVLALFAVLLSGSKIAVAVCLVGLLISLSGSRRKFLYAIVAICSSLTLFYGFVETKGFYALDRLLITVNEIYRGEVGTESSVGLRAATHELFIRQYPSFLVGSFDASVALPQFQFADFDTTLMARNPHSMLIELHGLFGFVGLIVSLCLGIGLWRKLAASWRGVRLWYFFFSVLALSCVSSSTLHSGVFFALAAALATRTCFDSRIHALVGPAKRRKPAPALDFRPIVGGVNSRKLL